MSNYREMFEVELQTYGVTWCKSHCTIAETHSAKEGRCTGCHTKSSHTRGFAIVDKREVHFTSKVATRATFMGALHELGHVVMGHGKACRLRRFEIEAEATTWAIKRMRELGVPVPREEKKDYDRYVSRMKRWGDNSTAGRNRFTGIRSVAGIQKVYRDGVYVRTTAPEPGGAGMSLFVDRSECAMCGDDIIGGVTTPDGPMHIRCAEQRALFVATAELQAARAVVAAAQRWKKGHEQLWAGANVDGEPVMMGHPYVREFYDFLCSLEDAATRNNDTEENGE